jgi:hypothetical protein
MLKVGVAFDWDADVLPCPSEGCRRSASPPCGWSPRPPHRRKPPWKPPSPPGTTVTPCTSWSPGGGRPCASSASIPRRRVLTTVPGIRPAGWGFPWRNSWSRGGVPETSPHAWLLGEPGSADSFHQLQVGYHLSFLVLPLGMGDGRLGRVGADASCQVFGEPLAILRSLRLRPPQMLEE